MQAADKDKALAVVNSFLQRSGKGRDELPAELSLYGDGLELDSLEAAELSASLEDEFGSDPFSTGQDAPETIGDILAFYEPASSV